MKKKKSSLFFFITSVSNGLQISLQTSHSFPPQSQSQSHSIPILQHSKLHTNQKRKKQISFTFLGFFGSFVSPVFFFARFRRSLRITPKDRPPTSSPSSTFILSPITTTTLNDHSHSNISTPICGEIGFISGIRFQTLFFFFFSSPTPEKIRTKQGEN